MRCSKCAKELDYNDGGDWVASISGSIIGDECIETFYFCKDCNSYTVEICWSGFLGDEKVSIHGPLSKEEGDVKVRLIGGCSEPWDKKCRCEAHRTYFGNSLD